MGWGEKSWGRTRSCLLGQDGAKDLRIFTISQESLKLAFCNKPSHVTRLLLDDLKIKGSIPGGFLWHLLRDFYQALCDGLPNTPLPTLTANRNLVSLNMDFLLYCRIFGKHLETVTSQRQEIKWKKGRKVAKDSEQTFRFESKVYMYTKQVRMLNPQV